MGARALWLNGRCSEQKEEVQAQPKQLEALGQGAGGRTSGQGGRSRWRGQGAPHEAWLGWGSV